MQNINPVIDAAKTVTLEDTIKEANLKLIGPAFQYCKNHTHSNEVVLLIGIRGLKPLIYSHSFDFAIHNLPEKVQSSLELARRMTNAEIVILEWFTSKNTKIPYYVKLA